MSLVINTNMSSYISTQHVDRYSRNTENSIAAIASGKRVNSAKDFLNGESLINSFRVFDQVWVMTQGGPGRYSEVLAVTMYREGFVLFDLGYAASVAVLISLVGLVFSYFYLRSVLVKEDVGN